MQKLVEACAAAGVDGEAGKAIDKVAKHVEERKKALA
jgi:hypothetical protein